MAKKPACPWCGRVEYPVLKKKLGELEKQLAEAKALCREAAEELYLLPWNWVNKVELCERLRAMGGE